MDMLPLRLQPEPSWSDQEVIARVLEGQVQLFELLMRRHNERIYRSVRSILRDETESEDAMQAAYLHAYEHLREFESRSSFATWLTRIAFHEALGRKRKSLRTVSEEEIDRAAPGPTPEQRAEDGEQLRLLTRAVDGLPEHFRTVVMLRQVQGLSVVETACILGLRPQTVKTRLHRARAMLRQSMLEQLDQALPRAFPFKVPRCDRVVAAVLARIGNLS
jgi:RNA polymerase sigma-70 factor, ECF subfamily